MVNVVSTYLTNETRQAFSNYWEELKAPAMKLGLMYLGQAAFTFIYIHSLSCVGERMASQLRQDLFSSIIQQDIAFFDSHRTGELINRYTLIFRALQPDWLKGFTQADNGYPGFQELFQSVCFSRPEKRHSDHWLRCLDVLDQPHSYFVHGSGCTNCDRHRKLHGCFSANQVSPRSSSSEFHLNKLLFV